MSAAGVLNPCHGISVSFNLTGGEAIYCGGAPDAPVHPDGVHGGRVFCTRKENVGQKEEIGGSHLPLGTVSSFRFHPYLALNGKAG